MYKQSKILYVIMFQYISRCIFSIYSLFIPLKIPIENWYKQTFFNLSQESILIAKDCANIGYLCHYILFQHFNTFPYIYKKYIYIHKHVIPLSTSDDIENWELKSYFNIPIYCRRFVRLLCDGTLYSTFSFIHIHNMYIYK